MVRRGIKEKKTVNVATIAATVAGLVVAAAGLYSVFGTTKYDPRTGCSGDVLAKDITFIIDSTTPLTPSQSRNIKTKIQTLVSQQPIGTSVRLHSVETVKLSGLSDAHFRHCTIARGDDVSEITGSRNRTELKYQARFWEPLSASLDEIAAMPGSQTSPLFESIVDYSINVPTQSANDRQLIFISDLQQHSSKFSLYKKNAGNSAIKNAVATSNYVAALQGVDVQIWVLMDSEFGTDFSKVNALVELWQTYFNAGGASIEGASRIR